MWSKRKETEGNEIWEEWRAMDRVEGWVSVREIYWVVLALCAADGLQQHVKKKQYFFKHEVYILHVVLKNLRPWEALGLYRGQG